MNDTTASRCLDLIYRHCPRLMKEGGGALPEDRACTKLSQKTIDKIIELRRSGWSHLYISRKLGYSLSAVKANSKRLGI